MQLAEQHQPFCDLLDGSGIEQGCGVANCLLETAPARSNDGAAGCHRLERRKSEALVQGGEAEPNGTAVELSE
jgi:hypothetical protein